MTKPARQQLPDLRLFTGAPRYDNFYPMREILDTRPMAPSPAPADWVRRHGERRRPVRLSHPPSAATFVKLVAGRGGSPAIPVTEAL